MAATFNIGSYWTSKSQVDTLADLEAGVEQLVITNIGLTEMSSTIKVVHVGTSQPASPTSGQMWNDTNVLAGAPDARLKRYVAEWRGVGGTYSATAPATTDVGERWYDMDNELWRTYRDATDDPHGIAGWHPEDTAFQLWKNVNAGTINKGAPIVNKSTTSNVREFDTTAVVKDQSVVGVANETINTGNYGVIATVAGGAYVDLYVGNASLSPVVKGDLIITSSTAGEAREAGPRFIDPRVSATASQTGTAVGAFAEAVEQSLGDGLIQCKLLGYVGAGAEYRVGRDQIAELANLSLNNAYHEIDLTSPPDAGASVLADASHAPLVAVSFGANLQVGKAAGGSVEAHGRFYLSSDGTDEIYKWDIQGQGIDAEGASALITENIADVWLQTSNQSLDGLGERFRYKAQELNSTTFRAATLYVHAYRF